ncbi:hypothetical protein NEDG_01282 [Nematocida displodere]|uniref:DUF1764 domain-containing protein n=1 Tax=Nematocida displodere TaxID=1805483 RepID=A0A177EDZ1_9MICR|nr:hypothetical protein NEDG_01282 [Nematocida displodere]
MDEIDRLFKRSQAVEVPPKPLKKKEKGYNIRGDNIKVTEEYTEDGYRIYTEEELKIGRGGDSAACPLDCKCCF